MNNSNNFIEIDKINFQLEKADIQKNSLILNIYREYELYLNLVRDLLYTSVEKGLCKLCSDPSIKNVFLNSNDHFCSFEEKIRKQIFLKLPLITIEQLKINKLEENLNNEIDFNTLERPLKRTGHQIEKLRYEDGSQLDDSIQFQVSEDISNSYEYYQAENHEKFISLDLDINDHTNFSSNNHSFENVGLEKKFISSLMELIGEIKIEKPISFKNYNINQNDNSRIHQTLEIFDLIDNSLENLLLNLSYKINLELFKSNLIKKMLSQDSFEYLVRNRLLIKHPHPFIINFEFSINQSTSIGENLPSNTFFNISIVELEFININLSIQRNKIKELKNQFQRLIKKETYWRQKEISLNKIR